jgi:hypothetical protein
MPSAAIEDVGMAQQKRQRKTGTRKQRDALRHPPNGGSASATPVQALLDFDGSPALDVSSPSVSRPAKRANGAPAALSPSLSAATPMAADLHARSAIEADGGAPAATSEAGETPAVVDYHHNSEIEFSRLLDYYGIEWDYEPRQFPIQWRDGRPTEMFTPDFYLPEYDLYIELTTMRQALVRRKNRKLRLLRSLYPEINIKLLYRRDYQRLLERFGFRAEPGEPEQQAAIGEMDDTTASEETTA